MVVALAPLPLAANRPWAWSLLAILVALLLAGWAWAVATGRSRLDVSFDRLRLPASLFAIALAWAAFQALGPAPQAWLHPLWQEAWTALGGAPSTGSVSLTPENTLTALMRLMCYGVVFFLAVQLGRERGRAHRAQVAASLIVMAYSLYGLVVFFSGSETILWLPKWAYLGDLTSTFVNRNSFGAFAGLGCVAACGLFLFSLRARRAGREASGAHAVAERILLKALPWLMVALIIGTALLLSHSRGAFLSTGIGLAAVMVGMVACGATKARSGLIAAVVLVGVALAAMGMSGEATFDRLAGTDFGYNADKARTAVYALVMQAIGDAPLTGYGLGAFEAAFAIYRDTTLSEPWTWDYAHNVHLETAMELGLPATVALYGAISLVFLSCLRGIAARRRDQIHSIVAVASGLVLGVHGMVDFSIQMPAVAVMFCFILGVGYAQSWNTAPSRGKGAQEDGTEGLAPHAQ